MEIRKATAEYQSIIMAALANKNIDYISPAHAQTDILNGYMYMLCDNEHIVAICSLLPNHRGYMAIKRLCTIESENNRRGIARIFFDYFCSFGYSLGATPWVSNNKMLHIMDTYGFEYQYTFNENYMFYLRKNY